MINKEELDKLMLKAIINSDYSKCLVDGKEHSINKNNVCTKCGVKLYRNLFLTSSGQPIVKTIVGRQYFLMKILQEKMKELNITMLTIDPKKKYCDNESIYS